MIDPSHYDCGIEPEEAAQAERRHQAESQEQLRRDSTELARIRAWATHQSAKMDDLGRPPDGDDWNDLYAQIKE